MYFFSLLNSYNFLRRLNFVTFESNDKRMVDRIMLKIIGDR